MKIKEKLEILRDYYDSNRKVGHTTLLKEGTKNYSKDKLIVAYKKECIGFLEVKPSEIISWSNLNALHGNKKPIVIDNDVMSCLLNETLEKITKLERKIKD